MLPNLLEPQINKELAQYENDLSWVLENYRSLIERYANEFVAVLNQKVLTHSTTIEELCEELRTKHKEHSHRAVIEFIYPEHPNFVFRSCKLDASVTDTVTSDSLSDLSTINSVSIIIPTSVWTQGLPIL